MLLTYLVLNTIGTVFYVWLEYSILILKQLMLRLVLTV